MKVGRGGHAENKQIVKVKTGHRGKKLNKMSLKHPMCCPALPHDVHSMHRFEHIHKKKLCPRKCYSYIYRVFANEGKCFKRE